MVGNHECEILNNKVKVILMYSIVNGGDFHIIGNETYLSFELLNSTVLLVYFIFLLLKIKFSHTTCLLWIHVFSVFH